MLRSVIVAVFILAGAIANAGTPVRPWEGHKIARVGAPGKAAVAEAPSEEPKREARPPKEQARRPSKAKAPKKEPVPEPAGPGDRSPIVEDISGEWNGPMPSFLSVSAG